MHKFKSDWDLLTNPCHPGTFVDWPNSGRRLSLEAFLTWVMKRVKNQWLTMLGQCIGPGANAWTSSCTCVLSLERTERSELELLWQYLLIIKLRACQKTIFQFRLGDRAVKVFFRNHIHPRFYEVLYNHCIASRRIDIILILWSYARSPFLCPAQARLSFEKLTSNVWNPGTWAWCNKYLCGDQDTWYHTYPN